MIGDDDGKTTDVRSHREKIAGFLPSSHPLIESARIRQDVLTFVITLGNLFRKGCHGDCTMVEYGSLSLWDALDVEGLYRASPSETVSTRT